MSSHPLDVLIGGPAIPILTESHMPALGLIISTQRVRRLFLKSSVSRKSAHSCGSMRCSSMYWPFIFSGKMQVSLSLTLSGVVSMGLLHLSQRFAKKSLTEIEVSATRVESTPL